MKLTPVPVIVFCLSLAAGLAQAGEVYKWVDSTGKVHYGQKKPDKKKNVEDISRTRRSGDTSDKTYANADLKKERPAADDVKDAVGSINKQLAVVNKEHQDNYGALTAAQHEAKTAADKKAKEAAEAKVSELDSKRLAIEAKKAELVSKLESLARLRSRMKGEKALDDMAARMELARIMGQ